jgi:poly(3-hydroxybutyrate) depolymerase
MKVSMESRTAGNGRNRERLKIAGMAAAAWIAVSGLSRAQQAEPSGTPYTIPRNVEVFTVKTVSPENREVPFYLRWPEGYMAGPIKHPYRVLFICPHYNQDGRALLHHETALLKLADQKSWFVVVPTFKNKGDVRDRKTCYYYPEKWSGKAVIEALEGIKRKYPVDTERLLMQGLSGGGQFVHRFAIWAPERVTGVAINSSSWFDQPNDRTAQVAWLVTIGDSDPSYENTLTFLDQLRRMGALPLFRSYAAMVHEGNPAVSRLNAEFLTFYDELTRRALGTRRPFGVTKVEPPLSAPAMPFVGDAQNWRFVKNAPGAAEDIPEDSRIYLPSENLARLWGKQEEAEK